MQVPSTTTNLLNWKESVGSHREHPGKMHHIVQTVVLNHNPTWGDMQTLLNSFFTPEEKWLVLDNAQEENERWNARDDPTLFMLKSELKWDPNTGAGHTFIKQYQEIILYGNQNGVSKQTNISKLYEIKQDLNENPSVFYERLCEVARKWTDLDLENKNNRLMFNMFFIGHSAPNVCKK